MSAAITNVAASTRSTRGKGAARRLRSEGQIPAVAYGKGLTSALSLAVSPKDIASVLKSERGQNTVLKIDVPNAPELLALIKSYTLHPIERTLEHVDFLEVKLDRPVDVDVPLVAHGKPVGLVRGGIVRQVYRTIPVRCVPNLIPLKIEVDIANLDIHESLHASALPLPEGVTVRLPAEQTVIAIVAPEKDRSEDAAAAAFGAAPAAAGKAPAAAGAAKAAAPAKDDKKKK